MAVSIVGTPVIKIKIVEGETSFEYWRSRHAVHVRHANIGNHNVEDLPGELALGSLSVRGNLNFVPFLAEADFQQLADGGFVVDDEKVCHARLTLPHGTQFVTAGCDTAPVHLAFEQKSEVPR